MVALKGCGATNADVEPITVSGEVSNDNTGNPIEDAIVEITAPGPLRQAITTDSLGQFSFTFEADSSFSVTIEASKQGYNAKTTNFKVAPETDVTDLIINLVSQEDPGGGDGGEQVGGEPEGAAAIVLTGISNQAINIAETGDQVSSAFTFQVQDSAGRALNSQKAVDVQFNIISGPGGGEELIPATARTNAQGQATSSLFSGNTAGPVKIEALVERPEVGLTIRSKPVIIAIHGGFPDEEHFSIAPDKYNFEGYDINGNRNSVTVIVGDKFSNPVKPGTSVYFSTTGGVIQGSGATDDDGIVTADLISGEPRPNDNITGSGGRPGYSTVTATTVDENDNRISKDINVVFSTQTASISASPTTFDLAPNGGESFTYTVTDLNGNPMAAGTQISVEGGEGIEVTGDNSFTLGNHLFPGPGATDFNFSIRDTDEESNDPASLTIKISVTTPSGNTTTYTGISGTRRKVR
ncbi:carboxypeptidase regulatory-like domain-containing protein [Aliifodinibius sp. S!AR15-10]|uniref:carboxypeptidase regulatory-like domain-containing protein n=1 Tax=Aliifodinibius sp. S!AR15-10 TaxID=2950437 RepID=UPI00286FCE4C|nr:carboxypeptidase regulatory-like domain-containing protein [Aliifodinibius sp. S!AR15-10]